MSDILDQILARKREEVTQASRLRSLVQLETDIKHAPATRGFAAALHRRLAAGQSAVIAEIKKASPSKGLIRADFDPVFLAQDYARGGATCLSVLTDRDFFQGAPEFLHAARAACELPVLRKDFMIDAYQVAESRALGADAILLIVAALDDELMQSLASAALALDLDVLVEIHDADELQRALRLQGDMQRLLLGINNRNLRTFQTSLETTQRLMQQVPTGRPVISESGIFSPEDIQNLQSSGVNAFLIGESLMRQPSPGAALQQLLGG